ncbi:MAG: tetratricopeptide repeat protein, partial [Burkholderiales bacterium]|nr:tetratricopeptide repeat protein [Burkholderiales bacterium]
LDLSAWPGAPPAIDVVQALLDKSLLRTWDPAGRNRHELDELYFGMYLSIREYAAAKLAQDEPAAQEAESRHGRYFAALGTDDAIEALSRHGGTRLRRKLGIELDNLVGACRRAVDRGDVDVAAAAYRVTWEVLELSGPAMLGATLGAEVLAMSGLDPRSRAMTLAVVGRAQRRAGKADDASVSIEEALAHFRAVGDATRESNVLAILGNLRRDQGRAYEARDCLEAACSIARKTGNRPLEGHVLGNLGILHAERGELDDARAVRAGDCHPSRGRRPPHRGHRQLQPRRRVPGEWELRRRRGAFESVTREPSRRRCSTRRGRHARRPGIAACITRTKARGAPHL